MDLSLLINMLSGGEFKSGVQLAEELGVSRTSVWNAVNILKERGVQIEKVKGKGYRVRGGLSLLRIEEIVASVRRRISGVEVECVQLDDVGSTNQFLMDGSDDWRAGRYYMVTAESQSSGRGRRGKVWHSPYAKNIYLSLGFIFEDDVSRLEGLSLVVGVVIARVLNSMGVETVQLKWPNDIYVDGVKLGGVLIELAGEFNSRCSVVIGLGLNVDMQEVDDVEGLIDQPWVSLAGLGFGLDRTELIGLILAELVSGVECFFDEGLSHYYSEWEKYDYLKGKDVEVLGRKVAGVVEGIDQSGCLLLNTQEGVCVINSGEVSVRLSNVTS